MAQVSDFLLERLSQWNVKRIYGYPGDGINGILGALERHKDLFDFVQVRHEEMAAFMATAHAKFTGEVGVCLATSGPGAIHLLNGLYDAKMDHQPVVAIVGQAARPAIGGNYQQEVDLLSLFKDVAGEYVHMASSPMQVRHLVDRAFRIAQAERTVTCVILPKDIQEMGAVENPPHAHNTIHTGIGYSEPRIVPKQEDLQRAATVLNEGKKVAILVGAGALGASKEVADVAGVLGAGVAKALLGKAVLPDYLPYVTGCIGLLGTKPSWDMMMECDTLLMIGSSFPYAEFLPKEGQARGVQIDIDPARLSLRYPMEVNLRGDSAETLRALLPLLQQKKDRSWREKIEKNVTDWWKLVEARAQEKADPVNPELVFLELSKRLPENAILTADAGTTANWYGRVIRMKEGNMGSLSGSLATMGAAVPYAIAAKFAYPDRIPICTTGDGAMQMNGLNELITVARYWKNWSDPRIIFMVLNNRDLNQVTWEMRILSGNPKLEATQNLPDFPYAQFAESLGFKGIRVERPEDVASAWDEALRADRPVVYEACVTGEVPTLPPHITFEQAKNYLEALVKGDPEEGGIIKQSAKELVKSVLPTKK
ncbi:pyruvate dehydrogenase (quinone) [Thermosporothrix hazakensis]|jgi:pyruvate dehydrogenase (quinone)|uniref:Pyruvate dehydrogenase (Quinone) n=1 Tax=Thermosporothrix hazakensis TaxID=644383 RepID=A0A326U9V7_THEHA|nr:thiamine pyrophosphate-requiring protein [Thermosporothrix hazakensis]PZW31983.1 pyruvate dehydrogenase (quinone) [Thermosporothrix hazakensis]GCE49691.1 thiamine pyrophosphate-requiring protein [Thermosporothrix hazakensis]